MSSPSSSTFHRDSIEGRDEGVIEGVLVVVRVDDGQVVDIDADVNPLAPRARWRLHRALQGEYALIRVCLSEAKIKKPREQRALPPSTSLGHSVNRFEDLADLRASVFALAHVTRGRVTVNRLTLQQLALQVGCHEVEAAHLHARVGRKVG